MDLIIPIRFDLIPFSSIQFTLWPQFLMNLIIKSATFLFFLYINNFVLFTFFNFHLKFKLFLLLLLSKRTEYFSCHLI
jgi:hypothetical protein